MKICKICEKSFKTIWHLDRHLKRKIPCKQAPQNSTQAPQNSTQAPQNSTNCYYCNKTFSRKDVKKRHEGTCKERYDIVRNMEIQLDIMYPENVLKNECRFCNHKSKSIYTLPKHIQKCKAKQEYRKSLETKLRTKTKQQHVTNNNQTINNTINVVNISAETLRKFGNENTDHITNEYLRKIISRLGVTLPKVVSTVAKQIYCDDSKPENKTLQITNVRSQWAKVSNGNDYELQPLGDSIHGVRNKVTDLYVERQCDEPDYFKKVNSRIEKLDDLNNQNFTAKSLKDREDQKNASKLKSEIDREIKSTLYNVQKSGIKLVDKS
jgi:hypothetical protein